MTHFPMAGFVAVPSILVEKTWQMGEDVAIHFADNLPEGSIQNFAFGDCQENRQR